MSLAMLRLFTVGLLMLSGCSPTAPSPSVTPSPFSAQWPGSSA